LWTASAPLERAEQRIGCGEQDRLVTTLAQAVEQICLAMQAPAACRLEDKPVETKAPTGAKPLP
jgi:hypothetical protein